MKPGYVPMAARARAVEIALYVVIALDLVSIVVTTSEISLLNRIESRGAFTVEQIESNLSRTRFVALLGLFALLVAGVLFLRWLRQGCRNTDVLAPGLRRHGHGWAIGAWFVPFLNLWRPKQIVNDVYAAGRHRVGGAEDSLLSWWWGMFLVSGFIGTRVMRMPTDTVDQAQHADRWLVIADLTDVVAAVLAILVVRKISRGLDDTAGRAPAPAPVPGGWHPPTETAPTFAPATGSVPPPGWA